VWHEGGKQGNRSQGISPGCRKLGSTGRGQIIRRFISKLLPFRSEDTSEDRLAFGNVGFHGDLYLLELVHTVIRQCEYFVETGANVGTTLAYVARTYPNILCLSCEPDKVAYRHAKRNVSKYPNVAIYNETSHKFLKRLLKDPQIITRDTLYWLDAHGYGFKWPLREEIRVLTKHCTKAFFLIDDFRVPGLDCFGYDQYENQICSFEYIKDALNERCEYRLYYPRYTDRTSTFHPLRGWGLIEFGHSQEIDLPETLSGKVRRVQ